MNQSKKLEVWPFLDWSLVGGGQTKFVDYENRPSLPSAKFISAPPYGIKINSQEAENTRIWLKAEKPWEAMCIVWYSTVLYEDGMYRLWYDSHGPGYRIDSDSKLCYAESSDGFTWRKPTLNLREYEGDKRTNIVFDKNLGGFGYWCGTVFLDPVAPPSERYKLIYSASGGSRPEVGGWQVRGAVSKDGLVWKPIPEPILDNYMGDTQTVAYYDRKIGAYVGYFRSWTESGFSGSSSVGYSRRAVARAITKDFREWPIPETILSLGIDYHPSHDLYTNAHVLYPGRDDLHLFFPGQFDREKDSIEVYLATSRDGRRLNYFGKRPIVPLGGKRSGREGKIYAGCGLVPLGKDKFALPCVGYSTTHWGYCSLPHSVATFQIGTGNEGAYFWATWEKDRLVAIEAAEEGFFSSLPIDQKVTKLYLNFTTRPAGELRVQIVQLGLYEEEKKPISGYTFSDCSPIHGDELKYLVSWRGKREIPGSKEKPVAIQFKMNQAKLFALYMEK